MVPEGRAPEAHGDLLDVKPIAQIAAERRVSKAPAIDAADSAATG